MRILTCSATRCSIEVYQFASVPVQAELTGPASTPDGKVLFLAVQHPGEESESPSNPTSTWPDGDEPKSSVIVTTGFAYAPVTGRRRAAG